MTEHEELLARLDAAGFHPFVNLVDVCRYVAAAIRDLTAKLEAERKAREEAEALLAGQTHIAEQLLGRGAGDDAYIIGLQEKLATAESRLAQAESAGMERAAKICEKHARLDHTLWDFAAAIRTEIGKAG